MFEINKVSKQYGEEFALNNVTMTIGRGLNFIVGASGSGKTTLMKIISGMEQEFEGEVSFCGKNIKTLSAKEKSYYYNNVFGFVWQDFNLLEEATVLENVLLPQCLKDGKGISGTSDRSGENNGQKDADKILRELKIQDLRNQKVKDLSGGQKQRVAIARELMKNPQVIFADEPTSALDSKTTKTIMDILRTLAKSRTVIVVTHDTSLINERDMVYELDKGELISEEEVEIVKKNECRLELKHKLTLSRAFSIAKMNTKNNIGRFFIASISLMIAGVLLLTTMSGAIKSGSQNEFSKLFDTYGETILNIDIVGSFISAAGAGGEEDDGPSADVTQDTNGLYEKYKNDERLAYIMPMQAYNDIQITVDEKSYRIDTTGSSPVINNLVAGRMTTEDNGFEVVVPEGFIQKMGISTKEAIGKEINFSASIYQWINDEPIPMPINVKATIVGVSDNTIFYEYEGNTMSYKVDDSFFFNKKAVDEIRQQAGTENSNFNFTMRAKTPEDLISLKDELNQNGIIPLGQFELVEDMVKLNKQTTEQSSSASIVIGILAIVLVIAVYLTTGIMRRREYAIYKANGYHNGHLCQIVTSETILNSIFAILLLLVTSPLVNIATKSLFGADILSAKMLCIGVILILGVSVVSMGTTALSYVKANISTVLKAGDR